MNNLGRRLVDRECNEYQRVVTEACNDQLCPKWTVSEWSEVGTSRTHHIAHNHTLKKKKAARTFEFIFVNPQKETATRVCLQHLTHLREED